MSHEIAITTIGRSGGFTVSCSCGETFLYENLATLDELNQIAHEHIEAAERSEGYGGQPCTRPGHNHPTFH